MNPKKTETVLDPACGTAGFLISSYKHILKANTDAKGNSNLTPDEKGRLAQNFKGYDISPDMVRLSLVNMYLHGFADPHIAEYDTLTSQDRWNEYADVILANPPFMSPKGGIKPHNRFSVQSKRSEVLFVDYMAEHLTPAGRAGVIVPEGIIFQGQTAHTQLRKMLLDEYLVAVVSLPAGVFNPYSGVKTSILILDKSLARRTNTIAFFKIDNDGFGLGAQRREIDKNDLPQAQAEICEYLRRLRTGETLAEPTLGLIVEKEKIAANGEYNLSRERYREGTKRHSPFPHVALEEIAEIRMGETLIKGDLTGAGKPIFSADTSDEPWALSEPTRLSFGRNTLVVGARGTIGSVKFPNLDDFTCTQTTIAITTNTERVVIEFLYHWLKTFDFKTITEGVGIPMITVANVNRIEIPLPPLELQKEIVAEIEGYQNVIDGARAVLDNYRPYIPIHPDWPMVELGQLCEIEHGFAFKGEFFVQEESDDLPILLTPGNFAQGGGLYFTEKNTKHYSGDVPGAFRLKRGDLVVVMTDLSPMMKILGMPATIDSDQFLHNQRIGKVVLKSKQVLKSFLRYAFLLDGVNGRIKREATGSTVRHTSPSRILSVKIPLPPLAAQQAIVAEIEDEQALVAANRELIARFEKKIETTLARVWGEDESAPAKA